MKFIADCMLGKLAKWLRILGYDTRYVQDADDDELVRIAVREDRVLLTRDRELCDRRMVRARCVYVNWGATAQQVRQVMDELGLQVDPGSPFTRCSVCNFEIVSRTKSQVEGRVPSYVYSTHSEYGECPACGRIYWHGTHVDAVLRALEGGGNGNA